MADTLSRKPTASTVNDIELQEDAEMFMEIGVVNLPATQDRLLLYQKEQEEDQICSLVRKYCKEGWPEKKDLDNKLIPYWKARGRITLSQKGLLLYDNRILVPESRKKEKKKHFREFTLDIKAFNGAD